MPTLNKLNDAQCRSAKPAEKAQKIFDGGGLYLYLFVSPAGAKTWRLAYRYSKKPKTISFGPYPQVSLAEARTKSDATKSAPRDGLDPMAVKRPTALRSISLAAASTSIGTVATVSQRAMSQTLSARLNASCAPPSGEVVHARDLSSAIAERSGCTPQRRASA
jgi:hypothetical protein